MTNDVLDITPDPQVLIALTHTPLKPLDALAELIDNAIDSFRAAAITGAPTSHPLVEVSVPGDAETRRGDGKVRVVDNGAGLDREGLADALRVGFSGKNRYDTLGLFGMGFNIATGKLGQSTEVTTARSGDDHALKVTLDLPAIVRSRTFTVPVSVISKPPGLDHGTIVEVARWWPDGNPNAGFVGQLAHIAKPQLRQHLGRRYATILRPGAGSGVRMLVNMEVVSAYEHCVWSAERRVERQGWGLIPARYDFNQVIHAERRCMADGTAIEPDGEACIACGRSEFRTIEERIRGWVGIQRFDDNDRFGIDLVRLLAGLTPFVSGGAANDAERRSADAARRGHINLRSVRGCWDARGGCL